MCHSPVFSSAPIQGQDFWQQLLNSRGNSWATGKLDDPAVTKDTDPIAGRSAHFPSSGLYPWPLLLLFKCSTQAFTGSGWACIQDQLFILASQPSLPGCRYRCGCVAHRLRSTLGSGSFPRCRSRLAAHSHLSAYRAHELFIFHSQATDLFPQLSPLLFTFLFPWFSSAQTFSPHAVPCRKRFTDSCRESPLGFSQTMLAISPLLSHLLP